MEFPDLGKQCTEPSCKQLDYLPVKCDACEKIFCHVHMKYASHNCDSSYKKNVQVPVCPLCNIPIPVKRGEQPDIAVSAHIDNHCQSDPAKNRRKTYTNKCSLKGCKTKELIRCICKECHLNFCLKHRHIADHKCMGQQEAMRKNTMQAIFNRVGRKSSQTQLMEVQGSMSEDEAFARALQLSMEGTTKTSNTCDQDRQLAMALSQSSQSTNTSSSQRSSINNCTLS